MNLNIPTTKQFGFLTLFILSMSGCDTCNLIFENCDKITYLEIKEETVIYDTNYSENISLTIGTDTDNDGLSDSDEVLQVTDANSTDSDSDGINDLIEVLSGTDATIADDDFLPNDPLFEYQWHLKNDGSMPYTTAGYDINVTSVWSKYAGTQDIKIGVVDSGIEAEHPDLKNSIDFTNSYRYSDGSTNPSPDSDQIDSDSETSGHGTSCAGIIGARGWNEIGVVGVAPLSLIVGFNVFSNPLDSNFQDALANLSVDVSSNSWGGSGTTLYDDPQSLSGIETGITSGRDGKGIIYVFASGNENANANYSTLHGSRYIINVSALDGYGELASYSNYGANIWVSAFGGHADSINKSGIFTTDLTGLTNGLDTTSYHFDDTDNSDGDYTKYMNGTSSATPVVAGACALILQANPDLTYRDLKYILATTSQKENLSGTKSSFGNLWTQNSAGHYYSPFYGFGIIDVASAVAKAETFTSLSEEVSTDVYTKTVGSNISSGYSFTGLTSSIEVTDDILIEHATVTLNMPDFPNSYLENLEVYLTSPNGTESYLLYANAQTELYGSLDNWEFSSVAFLDENSSGNWSLTVRDRAYYTIRTTELVSWKLQLFGRKE